MSCRSTPGSSACVTLACQEHGLEDAQVQSVLHDALRQAKNEGREASERAFARHLDRVRSRIEDRRGEIPARQMMSLQSRLAEGAIPHNMPDGHRRAALLDLDARAALAKRHLDGFIDDAAVRYREPTEKTQARYAAARAEAIADTTLAAPDHFVAGLQKGAFTWGAPRDRATAYALHQVASGLGYQTDGHTNEVIGTGTRICPECGEFMGQTHSCDGPAFESHADTYTGPSDLDKAFTTGDFSQWADDSPGNEEADRFYDEYGDTEGYEITARYDDAEDDGEEIAVFVPAPTSTSTQWPLAPEQAVSDPAVTNLNDTVESILTGEDLTQPVAVAVVSGGPAGAGGQVDLANGPVPVLNRNRPVSVAAARPGSTPALTLEQEQETFTDLSRARKSLDATVAQMEADLAARLDASRIREFNDDVTGISASPVGGVRYSQWDKERLISDISSKIAERDGLDEAEVKEVVAEYAKYAQVERFRTRQLRALGLRARDYAEAEEDNRAVEITYEAEPTSPDIRNDGLAYRLRQGMTRLNGSVSDLNAARDRVRTAPLPEAVRSLAAAKRMQDRLGQASEKVEDRMIDRMKAQRIRNIQRGTATLGSIHEPREYRAWDVDRANTAVAAKIAANSGRSEEQVSSIVGKLGEIAPVSGFRVRQLPQLGLSANDYSGNRTPRPRIKWAEA